MPDFELTAEEYRRTMGQFATGVTVLTTSKPDGTPMAMTANAVTSVSLDPLLLLVCVSKNAEMAPVITQANTFSLSILARAQQDLSNYFAGMWPEDTPLPEFTFKSWGIGYRLENCLGALRCRRAEVIEGGDHYIVMGEVTGLYRIEHDDDPLLYYKGRYLRTAPIE